MARPSIGRLAGELAVIVIGVLLALGAQAWWEAQLEKNEQRQALVLLQGDLDVFRGFVANVALVERLQESLDWLVDPTSDLLGAPDSVIRPKAHFALFNLARAPRAIDADAMLPTVADLKGSGRIDLLPDTVRRVLPVLESDIEALARNSLDLITLQETKLDELVISEFSLGPLEVADGATFQLTDLGVGGRQALASQVVQNTLVLKRSLLINQSRSRARLLSTIDVIRERVAVAARESGVEAR